MLFFPGFIEVVKEPLVEQRHIELTKMDEWELNWHGTEQPRPDRPDVSGDGPGA